MNKVCTRCGEEKPLERFTKHKDCKDGYSNLCKDCFNVYSRERRRGNPDYLAKRRKHYHEKYKDIQNQKEAERKANHPLKVRCQMLRGGMRDRARTKNIEFDAEFFTVQYLMERLKNYPYCECCHKPLDVDFKADKKFNDNSPSMDRVNPLKGYTQDNVAILCWRCNKHKQDASSDELRTIANFIDRWNNSMENIDKEVNN